eukprot:TRINITY_DN1930_c0_g1_i1.p1 TRINITY_DN1930_c0_g1~~TRINITY_DN1930_c0_g1_i1.p1  ORF type:complete len:258 (+),score=28.37 TRINITY_DN1930_c0_g1_i1:160-933(+)
MATASLTFARTSFANYKPSLCIPRTISKSHFRNLLRTYVPQNPLPSSNSSLKVRTSPKIPRAVAKESQSQSNISPKSRVFHGQCFVLDDNIDTDQIIPAEYLTLVPSKPEEYQRLGSYALIGLPARYMRFIEEGQTKTQYPIIIAGSNFGCGSSREHAPVALGASGVKAIVAESYARIFFRNSVSTGEVYPLESERRICDEFKTGEIVTVDLDGSKLINHTTGKEYSLKPIGDAGPVIDAGGIFNYARMTGMIAQSG